MLTFFQKSIHALSSIKKLSHILRERKGADRIRTDEKRFCSFNRRPFLPLKRPSLFQLSYCIVTK